MKNIFQQTVTLFFILFSFLNIHAQEYISVSPTSRNVGYSSGITTFTINLYTNKPVEKEKNKLQNGVAAAIWIATSNASWITVSPSSCSSFPSTITATYTTNSGTARTGTITVTSSGFGSQTVTISQAAAPPPVLNVSPTSLILSSSSGSTSFSISNSGGGTLDWGISDNASWLSCNPSSGYSNSASINLSYSANIGAERSATITVSSNVGTKTISVSQAAAPPILTVSPTTLNVSSSASNNGINISNTGYGSLIWTASSNQSWCSIINNSGGEGDPVLFYVAANTGGARSATITIVSNGAINSPQYVTINQAAAPPVLCVTPTNINVTGSSGSGCISVSNCGYGTMNWTASSNCSWLQITSGSSGTNDGTVCFTYPTNPGPERCCNITISAPGASGNPKTIVICQDDTSLGKANYSQEIPKEYGLDQNFPNPFNPVTKISYQIPEAGNVSLRIYDIIGKEIAILVDGYKSKGNHTVEFDGSNLSSGIYFYELKANNFHSVKKLLLTK